MGKDHTLVAVISIIILISALYLLSQTQTQTEEPPIPENIPSACAELGGAWLEEFKECEISDALIELGELCEQYNGEFKECDSPCRHNPETEVCAAVCVQVCSF